MKSSPQKQYTQARAAWLKVSCLLCFQHFWLMVQVYSPFSLSAEPLVHCVYFSIMCPNYILLFRSQTTEKMLRHKQPRLTNVHRSRHPSCLHQQSSLRLSGEAHTEDLRIFMNASNGLLRWTGGIGPGNQEKTQGWGRPLVLLRVHKHQAQPLCFLL